MNNPVDIYQAALEIKEHLDHDTECPPEVYNAVLGLIDVLQPYVKQIKE